MKELLKSLAIGAFLVLSACAKDKGGGGNTDTAVVPAPNSCPAGSTYTTQYGCLPQGGCQAGMLAYQNTCIPAVQNSCVAGQVYTQYGCLSQGSCAVGQAMLNTQCIQVYVQGGVNNSYNAGYYGRRSSYGYAYGGGYYGGGGGYYGGYYPNNGYYGGGVGGGLSGGFYIGGGVGARVPGMYYGY